MERGKQRVNNKAVNKRLEPVAYKIQQDRIQLEKLEQKKKSLMNSIEESRKNIETSKSRYKELSSTPKTGFFRGSNSNLQTFDSSMKQLEESTMNWHKQKHSQDLIKKSEKVSNETGSLEEELRILKEQLESLKKGNDRNKGQTPRIDF